MTYLKVSIGDLVGEIKLSTPTEKKKINVQQKKPEFKVVKNGCKENQVKPEAN